MAAHNFESLTYIFFFINMELSDGFVCLCRGVYMLVAFKAPSVRFLLYVQLCTDLRDKQKTFVSHNKRRHYRV